MTCKSDFWKIDNQDINPSPPHGTQRIKTQLKCRSLPSNWRVVGSIPGSVFQCLCFLGQDTSRALPTDGGQRDWWSHCTKLKHLDYPRHSHFLVRKQPNLSVIYLFFFAPYWQHVAMSWRRAALLLCACLFLLPVMSVYIYHCSRKTATLSVYYRNVSS